jgi:hypothetical protein
VNNEKQSGTFSMGDRFLTFLSQPRANLSMESMTVDKISTLVLLPNGILPLF